MSYPSPIEEKKPSFWHRPVPMWAFLLLVVIFILILFVPAFFSPTLPTIQQPLVLTPDSRSICISSTVAGCFVLGSTNTTDFTVANLNATDTISATATATLLFPNSTLVPANANVTLAISGVKTGNSFVTSTDGKSVSFPPGVSSLVVTVVSKANSATGNYTVRVSLSD
jgi:hypothetical protein